MAGFNITVTSPTPASLGEASAFLMGYLRAYSPELAALLRQTVRARTPRNTGGLQDAIDSKAYTGKVSGTRQVNLVQLFADDGPQLDAWGRVYAPYQEGPPLGLSTYTNGPRQMFYRVDPDDMGVIEAWALQAAAAAAADFPAWASGQEQTTSYGDTPAATG